MVQRDLCDPRLCASHAIAQREALETTGLARVLHAPAGLRLGTAAGDRAMDGLIDYAAGVGAEQIVYHAAALPEGPQNGDRLRREATALRLGGRRAASLNLRIAIENLAPLYPGPEPLSANPAVLRDLARQTGSEGVGVCLDLAHARIVAELAAHLPRAVGRAGSGRSHPVPRARQLRRRRGERSRDALGVDPLRLDLHLPPGRGNLPWHAIGPLVSCHRAPVVLEVHPPYRPRAAELREDAALLLSA